MGGRAKTVLVVDDDEDIREALAEVLRDEGCAVATAADGEQAMQHLTALVPELVITDLRMPRLDGWQLCALLRADPRLRETPIAVLTAAGADEAPADVRVIKKPLDLNALLGVLDTIDAEPASLRIGRDGRDVGPDGVPRLVVLVVDPDASARTDVCASVVTAGHTAVEARDILDCIKLVGRGVRPDVFLVRGAFAHDERDAISGIARVSAARVVTSDAPPGSDVADLLNTP